MREFNMKKLISILFLSLFSLVTIEVYAEDITELSRYTTVKNQATRAQINPLLMTVQVHFPQSVQTVGEGMEYLLRYSGYALVDPTTMSEDAQQMLTQPLPIVDRALGPLSLQEALEVLAGKHVFQLVQDPLHRKVSFTLLPEMRGHDAATAP